MTIRKTAQIAFNGKDITVNELTVAEISEAMDELQGYKPHVLDLVVDQAVPALVVMKSSGLDERQLMAATLPQLDELYSEVLKVNPSLAALTERLTKAVEAVAGKLPEKPSAARPASS